MNSSFPPIFSPLESEPGKDGRVTRFDLIAEARTWLDVPYVHQGRSRDGVDCLGLVIVCARALKRVAPDFDVTGYRPSPDGKSLIAECDKYMIHVANSELSPGHVVVIRWEKDPQHMGILGDYLYGGLSLIHALGTTDGKGRVVEHRLTSQTLAKLVRGYSMPGVD